MKHGSIINLCPGLIPFFLPGFASFHGFKKREAGINKRSGIKIIFKRLHLVGDPVAEFVILNYKRLQSNCRQQTFFFLVTETDDGIIFNGALFRARFIANKILKEEIAPLFPPVYNVRFDDYSLKFGRLCFQPYRYVTLVRHNDGLVKGFISNR